MSFKAISYAVAVIGAVAVCGGNALATGPLSTCPVANFKCAFSAVESRSLNDPSHPGRASVIIGYIVFDNAAVPTVFSQQNKDGVLQMLQSVAGTCTSGSSGSPGTLDFNAGGGPTLRFVTTHSGAELRFIDTELNSGFASETLGTCRQI